MLTNIMIPNTNTSATETHASVTKRTTGLHQQKYWVNKHESNTVNYQMNEQPLTNDLAVLNNLNDDESHSSYCDL